jgi:hypothetical protein
MLGIAAGMVVYFYRCGWIGPQSYAREVQAAIEEVEAKVAAVETADWDQQLAPTTEIATAENRAA